MFFDMNHSLLVSITFSVHISLLESVAPSGCSFLQLFLLFTWVGRDVSDELQYFGVRTT